MCPLPAGYHAEAWRRSPLRAQGCARIHLHPAGSEEVSPACAGMCPMPAGEMEMFSRLPCVRRDVPRRLGSNANAVGSPLRAQGCAPSGAADCFGKRSPLRAQGCAPASAGPIAPQFVSPACAGMCLSRQWAWSAVVSLPCVRRDVPPPMAVDWTRSCLPCVRKDVPAPCHPDPGCRQVSPACAGMCPAVWRMALIWLGLTCVRRDVPEWSMWL